MGILLFMFAMRDVTRIPLSTQRDKNPLLPALASRRLTGIVEGGRDRHRAHGPSSEEHAERHILVAAGPRQWIVTQGWDHAGAVS